jgi:hypothetical protein
MNGHGAPDEFFDLTAHCLIRNVTGQVPADD